MKIARVMGIAPNPHATVCECGCGRSYDSLAYATHDGLLRDIEKHGPKLMEAIAWGITKEMELLDVDVHDIRWEFNTYDTFEEIA